MIDAPAGQFSKTVRTENVSSYSLICLIVLSITMSIAGCGGRPSPTPPPPSITVSISTSSSTVLLGNQQQFTAIVTGTSNTSVTWSVNAVAGGNSTVGTISSAGLYTAPKDLPANSNVTIAAASQADPTKQGSATVTISSDISLSLQASPPRGLIEASAQLQLTVTIHSASTPDNSISWSVNGIQNGNSSFGTITTSGVDTASYTAPSATPSPASVTIQATSVADPSKSASLNVTVATPITSVLVAGGQTTVTPGNWTNTAEVFDVATQTWTPTQNVIPNAPPTTHGGLCAPNVALLGSGNVLLAGGGCSDAAITTNAASLYDPKSNRWTATSPMSFGRDQFGMITTTDGNAMVVAGCAGGCEGPNSQSQFFDTVSKSAEIYDAQTGAWSTVASLNTVHGNFGVNNQLQGAARLADGRVLACGGSDANITTIAACEIYDPTENTWSTTGALPQPCEGQTCPLVLLPNGNVLAIAHDGMGSILFNPAQGSWKSSGALMTKQIGGTLTMLGNGLVLLTGGSSDGTTPINAAELYDPVSGVWSSTASMNASRLEHAAVLLSDGRVLAAGGEGTPTIILSSAEIFDPATQTWTATAPMMQPRLAPSATGLGIHVSSSIVTAMISVGKNPQQAVITPSGAEIYVSNFDDNTVSVINASTNTVSSTVTVGGSPSSLAVSPDGSKIYVGNNADSISVIDTATKAVTTIATAGPVRQLALTPDGTKLYLAMEHAGLWQFATSTNSLSQVSSTACPEGVAVTPSGSAVYVSYQCFGPGGSAGHDAVGIFSTATNTLVGDITGLPNVGQAASISPNGAQFWEVGGDACSLPAYDHVGCPANPGVPESVVNVIGASNNALIRSLGGLGSSYISFFPDSTRAFLGASNNLEIVDTASFAIVNTVAIPASGSVAITLDGAHGYAPLPTKNMVAVLSTSAL